jgi:hypothetical protein
LSTDRYPARKDQGEEKKISCPTRAESEIKQLDNNPVTKEASGDEWGFRESLCDIP